jgi:hypothetical protein
MNSSLWSINHFEFGGNSSYNFTQNSRMLENPCLEILEGGCVFVDFALVHGVSLL